MRLFAPRTSNFSALQLLCHLIYHAGHIFFCNILFGSILDKCRSFLRSLWSRYCSLLRTNALVHCFHVAVGPDLLFFFFFSNFLGFNLGISDSSYFIWTLFSATVLGRKYRNMEIRKYPVFPGVKSNNWQVFFFHFS